PRHRPGRREASQSTTRSGKSSRPPGCLIRDDRDLYAIAMPVPHGNTKAARTSANADTLAEYGMTRIRLYVLSLLLVVAPVTQAQSAKHPLSLDDIQRIADVRDPQCSPDGNWVAYVVSNIDVREDKSSAH